MSFLNPLFLFALVAVAVPLLIYLFNVRKPKRIKFSTLTFFNSLKSSSLRKIKIKRWLLLAVRTLAIVALVLAMSKPFLPAGFGAMNNGEPKAIGIVIDNSPSMSQVDRNGPYLEQALETASDIIEINESDDRFFINVTNGPSMNSVLISGSAATREISGIEVLNSGNYLFENVQEVKQTLIDARETNKIIYFITDGQESQFLDLENFEGEENSDIQLQVVQLGEAKPSNVGFDVVDIISDEDRIRLRASVRNYGSQTASNQFLSLFVGGELIVQEPYEILANEREEFEFVLPQTDQSTLPVELLIEGDELTFDNRFYAAVNLPEQRNLLVIESENQSVDGFRPYLRPMLDAAVEENTQFSVDYVSTEDVTPDQLEDYDAIVLNSIRTVPDFLSQPLIDHVQSGAGLLLLPSAEGDIRSYNRLLGFGDAGQYKNVVGSYGSFDAIDYLATPQRGHPILETIFDIQEDESIRLNTPEIFYYYDIEPGSARVTTPIIETRSGNTILNEIRLGDGKLIYSAIGSDPGWSNFPIKPLFAPLFYRTVNYLVSGEGATLNNHWLGETFTINSQQSSRDNLELEVDGETILPTTRQTFSGLEITYEGEEWVPGWVTLQRGDQKKIYAINQHAMESSLISLGEQEMEEYLSSVFENTSYRFLNADKEAFINELQTASFGKEIWHWFIILAICLLLLESVISRVYKAESIN
ncbi:MAG: BatA domain-containing protein [Balneolaceae bacterium]